MTVTKKRVLVVDDDELVRRVLRRVLELDGHTIEEANDGQAAVIMFELSPADLVILDMIMPRKEGIETLKALRRISPGGPVIAISGGGGGDPTPYLDAAQQLGASAVMQKPLDFNRLLRTVDSLLAAGGAA
jgi:DNA-binding NtrC family response regulator